MSDVPCTEADLHPRLGDTLMKFKVEYTVVMTEDEAKELAVEEGTEDDAIEDLRGETEQNIQNQIEASCEFEWQPDNVKVNLI